MVCVFSVAIGCCGLREVRVQLGSVCWLWDVVRGEVGVGGVWGGGGGGFFLNDTATTEIYTE